MTGLLGSILMLAASLGAQAKPARPSKPAAVNRLMTAKLIYVSPMPAGLDRWIIEEFRGWGRYHPTGESAGVDLEMVAHTPPKKPIQYVTRHDVPQPKTKRWWQKKKKEPIVLSIGVINWVTGQSLWHADVLDARQKSGENPPSGPRTEIYAKGLTPAELAIKITTTFRRYVDSLQTEPGPGGQLH